MKAKILIIFTITFLASCSSTSSKDSLFKDKVAKDCRAVTSLTSSGFSIFPPLASMMAKSLLEEKAKEFNANAIVINKKEGIFMVEYKATGYYCF